MKIIVNILIVILVLLALLSGGTKVLLMPQELEFFGQFGFSASIIVVFGIIQLGVGVLLRTFKR